MAWTLTDNIRGPRGEKGEAGSIASADAESVPADQSASVELTGTADVKHAHFKIPRGLPGVNAVANDTAMAALVRGLGTDTRTALGETFVQFRLWNGTSYPTRIAGTVNIFVGPVDPGLLMDPARDLWANPAVTTLDDVVAAMLNPASALYAATKKTNTLSGMNTMSSDATVIGRSFGASPSNAYAHELVKGGTHSVRFSRRIPADWNFATVRAYWLHESGSGDARLELSFRVADATGVPFNYTTTQSYTSSGTMKVNTVALNNRQIVGGSILTGTLSRLSDSGLDTIAASIGVLEVEMERIS